MAVHMEWNSVGTDISKSSRCVTSFKIRFTRRFCLISLVFLLKLGWCQPSLWPHPVPLKENKFSNKLACRNLSSFSGNKVHSYEPLNPLTAEWALRALRDFTLSDARRFYSSMGNPLDGKGLKVSSQRGKLTNLSKCWPNHYDSRLVSPRLPSIRSSWK